MRILIIALKVGEFGPAAIVFDDLIKGLVKQGHEIVLVTTAFRSDTLLFSLIEKEERFRLGNWPSKLVTILFKKSYEHIFWENSIYWNYKKELLSFDPEIIFIIAGRGSEGLLNLGMRLSKYMRKPLAVHLVDPVPPPKHWENYEIYRKSLSNGISKALKHTGFLSMNNQQMLEHQQEYVNFDILSKSLAIPDPVAGDMLSLGLPPDKLILLYLGSFYGCRKPDSLLYGFSLYLQNNQEAELHIIGNSEIDLDQVDIPDIHKKNIVLKRWTDDVRSAYQSAKVLIDVDVDVSGDVFTSSKLKRYLFVDRMIVAITHPGSPSHHLLAPLKQSAFTCDHKPKHIASAIQKAIDTGYDYALFEERKPLIQELHADTAAAKLIQRFQAITKTVKN